MGERADVHELASCSSCWRITIPMTEGIVILLAKEYYRSGRKEGTLLTKGKVACGGSSSSHPIHNIYCGLDDWMI